MTKRDWLVHILSGGYGTSNFTSNKTKRKYVQFNGKDFVYDTGNACDICLHTSNFNIYVPEDPR